MWRYIDIDGKMNTYEYGRIYVYVYTHAHLAHIQIAKAIVVYGYIKMYVYLNVYQCTCLNTHVYLFVCRSYVVPLNTYMYV